MAATKGYGTTISGSSTGALGYIKKIARSGMKAFVIENTDMSANYVEKAPGILDAGEVTIDLTHVKATASTIRNATGAASQTWTITYPDGSTDACSGFISDEGNREADHKGFINITGMKITLTSSPTYTAGG